MDRKEDRIFQGLFQALLSGSRPPTPREEARARFWAQAWAAADQSRAYRQRAAEWRDAGSVDYAAELEAAADAHDADWDAKIRAHRDLA